MPAFAPVDRPPLGTGVVVLVVPELEPVVVVAATFDVDFDVCNVLEVVDEDVDVELKSCGFWSPLTMYTPSPALQQPKFLLV